jgi:hypothetical protein
MKKSQKNNATRIHMKRQKVKLATALEESTAAAKRAKKGKAGVIAQMRKRGYRETVGKDAQGNTIQKWKNVGVAA